MRGITFRGQKVDNGEWAYGYLVEATNVITDKKATFIFEQDATYFTHGEFACSFEVKPETIGQYTGVIDKNGKKVFEGDIVKVKITQTEDKQTYGDCKYKIGVIIYNNDFALFTCKNNFMNFINWAFNVYEVIGNIHDNHELLNMHKNG